TFACRRSGAAEYWRRSSVATGPIQSDVELGDTDRSEIPDRNRKPSSAPALKPRLTGTTALPPSKRSPNDLISSGSVRPVSGPRSFRLLELVIAPNSSIDSWGVKPSVNVPPTRVFVSVD